MRIHRNTVDNDWQFGHSQADFLVDCHAGVIQNIKTKLQEWKYNFLEICKQALITVQD